MDRPPLETEEAVVRAVVSPQNTRPQENLKGISLLLAAGWLGTNLGIAVADLPLKFLLKDNLHLSPRKIAAFFALGAFTNYIKPLAGILADSVPLFGTRRRYYLLLSLLGSGLLWVTLSLVPRTYPVLLVTYAALYLTIVFTSTTLGGVMVEAGMRCQAAGRLTAQRVAMFRLGSLAGGPIGGILAYQPFGLAMSVAAALHLVLVPLYARFLREPRTARVDGTPWADARRQLVGLVQNRPLLSAAGMICLLAASPGFGTPLFFYQTNTLHLRKDFIGVLVLVSAATGLVGATFYHATCRRLNLRVLLAASIVIHTLGTLTYWGYHSSTSAIVVTALNGITGTLAMLPVYDLAARGTPRGSEALGYSVMMSVWNLTNALSDWSGSWLYEHFRLTFHSLIWLNAGTTALMILAVPLLPAVLLSRADGVSEPSNL